MNNDPTNMSAEEYKIWCMNPKEKKEYYYDEGEIDRKENLSFVKP